MRSLAPKVRTFIHTEFHFSGKMAPFSQTCGRPTAVLGPMGAPEAARSGQGIIFHDLHGFRLHFLLILNKLLMIVGIVLEHNFADCRTSRNRNEPSRTAKNLQKSQQRNCRTTICRFAQRQQLQQTHAPKRRSTK